MGVTDVAERLVGPFLWLPLAWIVIAALARPTNELVIGGGALGFATPALILWLIASWTRVFFLAAIAWTFVACFSLVMMTSPEGACYVLLALPHRVIQWVSQRCRRGLPTPPNPNLEPIPSPKSPSSDAEKASSGSGTSDKAAALKTPALLARVKAVSIDLDSAPSSSALTAAGAQDAAAAAATKVVYSLNIAISVPKVPVVTEVKQERRSVLARVRALPLWSPRAAVTWAAGRVRASLRLPSLPSSAKDSVSAGVGTLPDLVDVFLHSGDSAAPLAGARGVDPASVRVRVCPDGNPWAQIVTLPLLPSSSPSSPVPVTDPLLPQPSPVPAASSGEGNEGVRVPLPAGRTLHLAITPAGRSSGAIISLRLPALGSAVAALAGPLFHEKRVAAARGLETVAYALRGGSTAWGASADASAPDVTLSVQLPWHRAACFIAGDRTRALALAAFSAIASSGARIGGEELFTAALLRASRALIQGRCLPPSSPSSDGSADGAPLSSAVLPGFAAAQTAQPGFASPPRAMTKSASTSGTGASSGTASGLPSLYDESSVLTSFPAPRPSVLPVDPARAPAAAPGTPAFSAALTARWPLSAPPSTVPALPDYALLRGGAPAPATPAELSLALAAAVALAARVPTRLRFASFAAAGGVQVLLLGAPASPPVAGAVDALAAAARASARELRGEEMAQTRVVIEAVLGFDPAEGDLAEETESPSSSEAVSSLPTRVAPASSTPPSVQSRSVPSTSSFSSTSPSPSPPATAAPAHRFPSAMRAPQMPIFQLPEMPSVPASFRRPAATTPAAVVPARAQARAPALHKDDDDDDEVEPASIGTRSRSSRRAATEEEEEEDRAEDTPRRSSRRRTNNAAGK